MKKQLAIILALLMLFALPISTSAALWQYTGETAGPNVYYLDFAEEPLSSQGAELSGGTLILGAGGSVTFDKFFDFDTETIEMTYEEAGTGKVTVETEKNSYEMPVDPKSNYVKLPAFDRKGSHTITVSSTCNITITSIGFHKAAVPGLGSQTGLALNLNEYDKAMMSAIAVDPSKFVIKVNGQLRFLDYTNTSLVPKNIDGRLYLPIHAMARALSIYYEDYPDLNYAYIMDDNIEIYQKEDECYIIKNGIRAPYEKFAIYLDGITWVPFRQMAELFGKTVVWREGIAVADDRMRANEIITNKKVFSSLQKDFARFDASKLQRSNTYYVSQAPYASDSNNGSENFPFRTIQRAADVAMEGDTVIIRGGTYRETVTVKNDGTATQPIIFKAAEGEEVIISAFEKVKGFTSYKGDIYQAIIPKSIGYDRNFVIKDDEIIREGRHPNTDDSTVNHPHPDYDKQNVMRATVGDIRMPVEQNTTQEFNYAVSDTDLNQEQKDYWKGGTFVTLTGEGWTQCYAMITGSKKGRINISHNGRGGYAIDNYYTDKRPIDYGYITHHINTVDQPGEWYIDDNSSVIYMMLPEDVDPSTYEIEVKQRQVVVDLTDRKFVQFHNISTRGGGITMAGDTEMDIVDGGDHKYISQIDWTAAHATADLRVDRDNRYTNKVDLPELGEVGFYAGGKNNAYVNTHIAYSAAAGIYATGAYSYLENNFIEHASYMGTYPGAINLDRLKADVATAPTHGGHTVVANTLVGSGRANLNMSNGQAYNNGTDLHTPWLPCDMSFNTIYMGATTSRDTGSFYSHSANAGTDWIKTRLHHNVNYDIGTVSDYSNLNALYYHDGWSNFINTYANVAFYTKPGYVTHGYYQHGNNDFWCYVEKWGNTDLGYIPGGMDDITFEDYPYGKPFDTGSTRDGHARFMQNYDKTNKDNIILACDAVLEGGAALAEDGFVDMPTKDATITFKNVTLDQIGSEVIVYYASDKYKYNKNTIPLFNVDFLQNGQVVATRQEGAYAHATNLNNQASLVLYLQPSMAGTYDVRVSVDQNYVRPNKLMFAPIDYDLKAREGSEYPFDGDTILLGTWDECLDCNNVGPVTNLKMEDIQVAGKTNYSIHATNQHQPVYKDRLFTNDATMVTMRCGSSGDYANTYIDIYVDDHTTPVATFDLLDWIDLKNKTAWKTVRITTELNRVIPAGVHTVYVAYRGYKNPDNGMEYGITDSHWISFHQGKTYKNSTPKLSELAEQQ